VWPVGDRLLAPPRSQRPGQGPRSPHPKAGPDYRLPRPSKLPQLRTNDVRVATGSYLFSASTLLAMLGIIHESCGAIKYWPPIGRNRKPFYDKHVFLLSSALQFTVIL
jgi:hypothetical protein